MDGPAQRLEMPAPGTNHEVRTIGLDTTRVHVTADEHHVSFAYRRNGPDVPALDRSDVVYRVEVLDRVRDAHEIHTVLGHLTEI